MTEDQKLQQQLWDIANELHGGMGADEHDLARHRIKKATSVGSKI